MSKYLILKRVIDFIFAIMVLPFFLLIVFIVGVLIIVNDKGTIFYKSKRIGMNGRIILIYKFRTMKMNAPDIRNSDGTTYNSIEDKRVTKIGKILRATSLDELPQIINIVKGEMSFIGPRPDLPDALDLYTDEQREKLKVQPGITGYNQAYFRNSLSLNEQLENDRYYANNVSLAFDIRIFFKTFVTVLFRKNIYRR